MRGRALGLVVFVAASLGAAPAAAQYDPYGPSPYGPGGYGPGGYGPAPSGPSPYGPQPSTTPTTPGAPGGSPGAGPTGSSGGAAPAIGPSGGQGATGPCAVSGRAVLSRQAVPAGDDLVLSGPAGSFAPGPATISILRAKAGTSPVRLSSVDVRSDGRLRATVTIPEETATGIHVVYVEGNDPAGQAKVLLAPVAVRGAGSDAQSETAADGARPVPACVGALQPTFEPGEEEDVVADVASGASRLVIDGRRLDLAPLDDGGGNPWGWSGAGAGVVVLGVIVASWRESRKRRRPAP